MASSVTTITAAKAIGDCTAYLLSGPIKLVALSMGAYDQVFIYEETATEGTYQLVERKYINQKMYLDETQQSMIFEGYGNYKFLLGPATNAALVVGYAS